MDNFRRLGIQVDVLQTDFLALHNFLLYEFLSTGKAADKAVAPGGPAVPQCRVAAAVDIGCDATNIVVSAPQSLWFHSCGVAGQTLHPRLVHQFKLSVAQAERLKRQPESAPSFSDLYQAIAPVLDDLLKETQHALAAYAAAQPDLPVEQIIGLGGGFFLHGLLGHLRVGQ